MKVLSVAWTIYDDRIKEFCGNCTGGGLVIKNICEYIGRKEDSYLLIGQYRMPSMKLGNINIIDTINIKDDDISEDSKKKITILIRALKKALKEIQPDIVNIHGIGEFAIESIKLCKKLNIKFVYTEHLFIGHNKDIEKTALSIAWEDELYKIPEIKIIAVSKGMKNNILENYRDIKNTDVVVIPNGTDFNAEQIPSDIKEKYKLENKKILLCVGTICKRKNQEQIIEAYKLLPNNLRNNIKILFCGRDSMEGELQKEIKRNGLEECLIYAGALSSEEMKKYYTISDGLIMPSLAEGLSIAALEQIAYGKPVIMFSDSECALDLNDEKVSCFAVSHDNKGLADAIEGWYNKEWNEEYIINYSHYYTMERMADDYIAYYRNALCSMT